MFNWAFFFYLTPNISRSVVYQFSSPTNLQPVRLPFSVQIAQLAVSQTHFVALTSGKFKTTEWNRSRTISITKNSMYYYCVSCNISSGRWLGTKNRIFYTSLNSHNYNRNLKTVNMISSLKVLTNTVVQKLNAIIYVQSTIKKKKNNRKTENSKKF